MIIETFTFIEVEKEPSAWAVLLEDCKQSMSPVKPLFITVANSIEKGRQVIDNTLSDLKPTKTINGVNGVIADSYIEVGFWRLKLKK